MDREKTRPQSEREAGPWDHPGLVHALVRLARGRTAVVGDECAPLRAALRARRAVDLVDAPVPDCAPGAGETGEAGLFRTIVVLGMPPARSAGSPADWMDRLGQRLLSSGRLVVCVANADAPREGFAAPAFTRRQLRRMLRPLGRPKVLSTQPFRFLVMHVRRTESVSRSTEARHAVIADLAHGSVLDLGCGAGELSGRLAARGLRVFGVDKNEEKIASAASRFPSAAFAAGDIVTFTPPEPAYDTVILAEVLEHVPADVGRSMLDTAWGRTGPGGRLIVSVPNEDCVPHPNHVREFDVRTLAALLAPLGTPRTVDEQPYKYLLMYVDRPGMPRP